MIEVTEKTSASHANPCFFCKNACGKCLWSKLFVPIPGWDAEPSVIRGFSGKRYVITKTFWIKKCPLFEDDTNGRRKY